VAVVTTVDQPGANALEQTADAVVLDRLSSLSSILTLDSVDDLSPDNYDSITWLPESRETNSSSESEILGLQDYYGA
jgi:hypothetical protein